jgi:hypothetical protein
MSEPIEQRRVLVVGRDYFFYTREIVAEMQGAFGAQVAFVPIVPPGLMFRVLDKAVPVLARRWIGRYHRKAIARLRAQQFDTVLFIQVHQAGDLVQEYRTAFAAARFILYYWDSLRTHDYLPYVRYFDRVFSFDRQDVARHPDFTYLPLFYAERFRALRSPYEPAWDLSFVGSAASMRRYEQLEAFAEWARDSGLRFNRHLVVSPVFFLRMLLRGRWLRRVRLRPLLLEQVIDSYASARVIVDLPNNLQNGFTMRTFEALGAHRKLITTNEAILKEDFYTPESVYVVGSRGVFPDASFFDNRPIFAPALETHSLRSWIRALTGWAAAGDGR